MTFIKRETPPGGASRVVREGSSGRYITTDHASVIRVIPLPNGKSIKGLTESSFREALAKTRKDGR